MPLIGLTGAGGAARKDHSLREGATGSVKKETIRKRMYRRAGREGATGEEGVWLFDLVGREGKEGKRKATLLGQRRKQQAGKDLEGKSEMEKRRKEGARVHNVVQLKGELEIA